MVFGVDFRQGRALTEDIQYLNTVLILYSVIIFPIEKYYILYIFFQFRLNIKSVRHSNEPTLQSIVVAS